LAEIGENERLDQIEKIEGGRSFPPVSPLPLARGEDKGEGLELTGRVAQIAFSRKKIVPKYVAM
jgi:hypothetical protein